MFTVMVTGGAGFIGSAFVRTLARAGGCHVVVLDKLTYAGNLKNLEEVPRSRLTFVCGDIADAATVGELFSRHRPRWVVNFAAETHVDRSIEGPRAFVHTNINGTFELLDAARAFVETVSATERAAFRFLHVSTDEVYGTLGADGAFAETSPYAPNSPYSASKAAADHLVRAYYETFALPVLITNCSNNYGPYQYPEKLVPLTILNALEGRPLPIYGDGLHVRDWLHVDDHCEAILTVVRHGVPGGKYNIGAAEERTTLEVVRAVCDILDHLAPPGSNPALRSGGLRTYRDLMIHVRDRPGHDRRYAIDATKIRRELSWMPRRSFREGLEQTVRWYLEHPAWRETVREGGDARRRIGLVASGSQAGISTT